MILRRFMHHTREQNWFAVGLDVLVVIVGIFLGLQVTDWNEMRKNKQTRLDLFASLKAELENSRAEFAGQLETSLARRDRALEVLAMLKACEIPAGKDKLVSRVIANYQSTVSLSINRTAYEEMTVGGHFASISDRALKIAIARVYFDFDILDKFQTYVRRDISAASRIVWDHADLGFAPALDPEQMLRVTADFEFGEACKSRPLRNAVWEMADTDNDWSVLATRLVRSMDTAIHLLGKGGVQ